MRLIGVTTGGRRQSLAPPVAFLALLAAAPALADAPADATARVAALVRERLPGEYDNHEQVWQAGLDGTALPARRHLRVVRVAAPRLGTGVFVIDVADGDGPVDPGERLLLALGPPGAAPVAGGLPATAWASDGRALPDPQAAPEAYATLGERALRRLARCELSVTASPDGDLDASPFGARCRPARGAGDASPAVPTDWRHDGETLWLATASAGRDAARRAAVPAGALRYRRAQHYTGWAAVKPEGPASTGGDDTYRFMPGITVHNEGQVIPILDPEGRRTGYAFQLARLTYQNTRTPILKLGLIDEATGATLVYSWAEPGAERIGINVRWAQVGLVRKPGVPSFAVDPPPLPAD